MHWRDIIYRLLPFLAPNSSQTHYDYEGEWIDAQEGVFAQGAALPWPTLTPREMEVAWCIRLGYTNQQIAQALGVSVSTVKSHVHNLLVKFHTNSRWQLRAVLDEMNFRLADS
jgi:DNA-binding NarL/FixJ family response regulator